MNENCLKLTAYFGERQRTDGQFLAEALLELYGRERVATSIMLRGTGGFGPRHLLRTDSSLSLSEDPPVAVAAVDTDTKISGLLDAVVDLTPRGLVTVERARLIEADQDGAVEDVVIPAAVGDAVKLTVYVGRQEHVGRTPAYLAVCDLLFRHGLHGASAFLGVDGTAHGRRHRARFFGRNVDVPMMIIAVGDTAVVERAACELGGILGRALMTVERVRVCKRDGALLCRPDVLPSTDAHGRPLHQKLMVYTSEDSLTDGVPVHRALVRRLRESQSAGGATALRGMWGFHGAEPPHGDRFLQLSRRVPVTTIVVDTPDSIARSFDIVDAVTQKHGLVTSEMVPARISIDEDSPQRPVELARYDY
ncbi:Uncharacterised protein [Mycolicibacterium vanbaalenii]|uniref:DUF190 domain-containing protein n=1 Tax=Mycolicibacterium vanbaalenii TaxID=110539 RepID=A0A5S9NUG2_MYCVN|nr:DUF190 domain-containing protein [Mycolicibacterium vanbaalenii]CAA0094351.1 Uncharacterised protein [Mycolicibacterium vanbaalenii]